MGKRRKIMKKFQTQGRMEIVQIRSCNHGDIYGQRETLALRGSALIFTHRADLETFNLMVELSSKSKAQKTPRSSYIL